MRAPRLQWPVVSVRFCLEVDGNFYFRPLFDLDRAVVLLERACRRLNMIVTERR